MKFCCCDKHTFSLKQTCFVTTNTSLSWQTCVCCGKTCVASKILLVAAPTSDRIKRWAHTCPWMTFPILCDKNSLDSVRSNLKTFHFPKTMGKINLLWMTFPTLFDRNPLWSHSDWNPVWILSDLSSRHSIFPKQVTCHEWLSPPSPIETLSGLSQIKLIIIIKVFLNCNILSLETILSTHTHTHTHTQVPVHTSILTMQSSKRLGDLEWIKTHVFIHLTYLIRSNLKTFFLHKTIALLWLTCPPCLTETLFEFYQI